MNKIATILFCSLVLIGEVFSQNPDSVNVKVVTKDGSVITGELVSETESEVIIQSATLGRIVLQRSNISSIDMSGTSSFEVVEDYYNSTRNFVSPTGFMLKKGQSYYENVGIFFNSFAFGVTDNFNVAVGGEVATLLFGEQFPILYVSPKFGVNINETAAWGIGTTVFSSPSDDFNGFGFLNTSFTFGNRNNNFTIGTGIGFDFSDDINDDIIPIMVGGNFRISRKISLVTDNFIILYNDATDTVGVLSAGIRVHFENGAGINVALWRPTTDWSDVIALPFVSATVPIGRGAGL